ncbi:MAG TPA: hypothetical protein VFH00_06420 [Candidatus Nitrosotalea sp.]|nr:hypothetical protein [Candidatus Nitrosotalea sp.]
MRTHLIRTSAKLALALVPLIALAAMLACGSSPSTSTTSPTSTCVNASAPHRAYVIVQHSSGTTVQKCVGFAGATIDGQSLMDQSGVTFQTQTFSFGKAICSIDNEPAQYEKCFATSGPNWSMFIETNGSWTVAQTGYADPQVILHDKDALGWRYIAYEPSPSPPPLPKAS